MLHSLICAAAMSACGGSESSASQSPAGVDLLARGALAADATDLSGLTAAVEGSDVPSNRVGSIGSGLAYTGAGNLYLALNDRGPKDGALAFASRFQTLAIDLDAATGKLAIAIRATTLFTDAQGARTTGLAAAVDASKGARLDPEGLCISRQGTLFTSDEYGPHVDEWTARGVHVRRLSVPARFATARPSGEPKNELPPQTTSGRQPNRGMEGLARSPDGRKLYGALQSPLIQDGALDEKNERTGTNVRVLELDVAGGPSREFVYALESPKNGVNELLAVGEHTLLALERDGARGEAAKFKRVYRVDLRGASDVSRQGALPTKGAPEGVAPLAKELLIDFLDPRFALAGKEFPEKLEGLTFGPDLPDGRRLLYVSIDNDFLPDVPNSYWAFALHPQMLADFVRPAFDAAWKP